MYRPWVTTGTCISLWLFDMSAMILSETFQWTFVQKRDLGTEHASLASASALANSAVDEDALDLDVASSPCTSTWAARHSVQWVSHRSFTCNTQHHSPRHNPTSTTSKQGSFVAVIMFLITNLRWVLH